MPARPSNRPRIAVLAGGDSPERDISLVSGSAVHAALLERGHPAHVLSITSLDDLVPGLAGVDIVFICLHGGSGEDGTVQLLLELMGIPYTGSGPLASHRAMDKLLTRRDFAQHRIPVPKGLPLDPDHLDRSVSQALDTLELPLVLKPVALGSSVGVLIIHSADDLRATVRDHAIRFGPLLAEEFVPGREFTAGILDVDGTATPLPVVEVMPAGPLFDHDAKETKAGCSFACPADIPPPLAKQVQNLALRAHNTLGCSGFSRTDMRLDRDEHLRVFETNTLPGMTPTSDLPRAAAAAGYDYATLVERMLATAQRPAATKEDTP